MRASSENENEGEGEGDAPPLRCAAHCSARALQGNYRAIVDQVPDHSLIPMIKADAYGHGAEWAARTLELEDGLFGFGVASLEEGRGLRKALGPRGKRTRIIVFSGTSPWTEAAGAFCERHALTPVISTDDDWTKFLRGGWTARLFYHLKFNTGMNRLGMTPGLARGIAKTMADRSMQEHPEGILSHLAIGDDPSHKLSQTQVERFRQIQADVSGAFPRTHFHLANSSAIWNAKDWGLKGLTDVARPGLSLYGVPPWEGAPVRGLESVMSFSARVMTVRKLARGEALGYGGAYVAKEPESVAILSAGYADGVHRTLSNGGWVWLGGRAERVRGRVSMDLTAVSCAPSVRPGEVAEFLGQSVDIWAQAKAAQTIPYELLTSVSARVQRLYG